MLQLYDVALTAGKAHKDHKHHHGHHYEHDTSNNTPRTTTRAPMTGPPLPPHPFLTGGQINTQVRPNEKARHHHRRRANRKGEELGHLEFNALQTPFTTPRRQLYDVAPRAALPRLASTLPAPSPFIPEAQSNADGFR